MADTSYTATVDRVRNWANRVDSDRALPDQVIRDALDFAADESYRLLEVASLEYTGTYPALTGTDVSDNDRVGTLRVPRDSTGNFLQIRRTATEDDSTQSVVYNTRLDLRAFEDDYTYTPDQFVWTRKGNNFLVYPAEEGDIFEVHYYRRLPALDATYTVNAGNRDEAAFADVVQSDGMTVSTNGLLTVTDGTTGTQIGGTGPFYTGNEAFNWLRDEQNKILLFGALWHVADYLENTQESQVWGQRFQGEIDTLNQEERKRRGSGGNTTITYQDNGLLTGRFRV